MMDRVGMRRLRVATALAGAALVLGVAPVAGAAGIRRQDFCVPRLLHDYEAPLDRLPAVRRPPASGKLPFGSSRVSFRRVAGFEDEFMIVQGDPLEYEFSLTGAAYGPKTLDWTVESRLVRIDRRGRGLALVKRRREHVGMLEVVTDDGQKIFREIGFSRSSTPGIYRYDLIFRNERGGLLGRYHDYYLVVAENSDVQLALNGASFRPGDQLLAQVQNFGTDHLSYGVEFSLERYEGAVWTAVDLEQFFGRKVGFIMIGLGLGPGAADNCSVAMIIPANAQPGRYRIVKGFNWSRLHPYGAISASAEFTIEPPA
jgi:hypothetical protein